MKFSFLFLIVFNFVSASDIAAENLSLSSADQMSGSIVTSSNDNNGISSVLSDVLYATDVQDIGLLKPVASKEDSQRPLLFWRQHPSIMAAIKKNLQTDSKKDKMFSYFGKDSLTIALSRPIFADIDATKYGMAHIVKDTIAEYSNLPKGFSEFFFDYDQDFKPAGAKYTKKYPVVLKRYQKQYSHWAVQIGNKEVHINGQQLADYTDFSRSQEGIILVGPKFSTSKDTMSKRKKKGIAWQVDKVAAAYSSWFRGRKLACEKDITDTSKDEIWKAINDASIRFFERKFDAFEHNCYKFASDIIETLCGRRVRSIMNSMVIPKAAKLRNNRYGNEPDLAMMEEPETFIRRDATAKLEETKKL